jgi:hypothetical protein
LIEVGVEVYVYIAMRLSSFHEIGAATGRRCSAFQPVLTSYKRLEIERTAFIEGVRAKAFQGVHCPAMKVCRSKSECKRFVHSCCSLVVFFSRNALDSGCDLRLLIEMGQLVQPRSVVV